MAGASLAVERSRKPGPFEVGVPGFSSKVTKWSRLILRSAARNVTSTASPALPRGRKKTEAAQSGNPRCNPLISACNRGKCDFAGLALTTATLGRDAIKNLRVPAAIKNKFLWQNRLLTGSVPLPGKDNSQLQQDATPHPYATMGCLPKCKASRGQLRPQARPQLCHSSGCSKLGAGTGEDTLAPTVLCDTGALPACQWVSCQSHIWLCCACLPQGAKVRSRLKYHKSVEVTIRCLLVTRKNLSRGYSRSRHTYQLHCAVLQHRPSSPPATPAQIKPPRYQAESFLT